MSSVRQGATDLYRYFDADGRLLYVGISFSAVARAAQHRQDKTWWTEFTRMEVERFSTRRAALDAELAAIRNENPVHNVIGRQQAVPKKVRAPWLCSRCEKPIGIKKGDGYLHVEWSVLWSCVCAECDEVGDATRYWIDASRVNSASEIAQWTAHLCRKRWFIPGEWSDCIWRSCTIEHAHKLALNIIDKHAPTRVAEREWDEMLKARNPGDAIQFYDMGMLVEADAFIEARAHEIETGSIQKLWKLNYMKHDECGMYSKLHHTSDRRALGHFHCWKCDDHFRVWGGAVHRWSKDVPVWPDGLDDHRKYDERDRLWAEHVASAPAHMAVPA